MTESYLCKLNIGERVAALADECEARLADAFAPLSAVCEANLHKVLHAFAKNRLSDTHFGFTTGYGYDDAGREVTERVFADVFGAEAALVRTQIVSGTHAIAIVFQGLLRPGDKLLYCTGAPYDSLWATVGIGQGGRPPAATSDGDPPAGMTYGDSSVDVGAVDPARSHAPSQGSLADFGISYGEVALTPTGDIDYDALADVLKDPSVRMAAVQRATGYSERPALTIEKIAQWASFVKERRPDVILMADNCYGEFLELQEPTDVGVDIMAGSLIKNPGGGLALSGGYVAGRADLVEQASYRLTCPGIGGECGLTFGQTRTILQGLFLAPRTVTDALKGAILCGEVFSRLGFPVFPAAGEARSDIIETIRLGSPEALIAFCEGIQAASPVDAFVSPVPGDMPGYADPVIMASGAFVSGSSIELSADGPLRPPYNAYFQGGLTYEHAKLGVMSAAQRLVDKGLATV
ncbi:MAG: methionine gamma-lyase family protein [Clostridiales bacterium]|nr:methionine gamma-lyase family protein [Clostridiales bacterium]